MKLNGNNLLGNRLKNCIFIHKHIGNPLHLERIVQVQLCTLAMRSLHMQWSLFKNNSYSTFTKQATRFSTTIVYIVNACLTHLVATWWQFPSHVCKLGILTLLPLLENEHKYVFFCGFQVCGHIWPTNAWFVGVSKFVLIKISQSLCPSKNRLSKYLLNLHIEFLFSFILSP